VLGALQAALLSKLDESRQLLQQTPSTQPEQLGQQLQLVQHLLQALATVRQSIPL
jgi:hypothetical protein